MSKKDIDRHINNLNEHAQTNIIHHGKDYTMVYDYYDRCIKQVVIELKEKQKEYRWGSDAYNVLRSLETTLPNVFKKELTK